MEINIIIEDEFKRNITKRRLKDVVKSVLVSEKTGDDVELGVMITTQEKVQELNRIYRNVDRPTDVLSFFMIPEDKGRDTGVFINPPDKLRHLGEVIISYTQADIQADENNHPIMDEIAILLVHGVLHLLGYDHEMPRDKKQMLLREQVILNNVRLGSKIGARI